MNLRLTRHQFLSFSFYSVPIFIVMSIVVLATILTVRDTMSSIAERYASIYSRVVYGVSMENKSALVAPRNCWFLQQVMRYEREILEMQIVHNGVVTCSSLGDVVTRPLIDIGKLKAISQDVHLASMPASKDLTVAVINRRLLGGKTYYAVSLIDIDYMRAGLGYLTERRTKSVALFVADSVTPVGSVREKGIFAYTAGTGVGGHEIQVVASNEYIQERLRYYSLLALPALILGWLALFYARRYLLDRKGIAYEIRRAIQSNEFVLHYQTQVNTRSGELSGVEALVRWEHPERGMIFPDVFIPVVEEFGLINQLTDLVVDKAIADFSGLRFKSEFHLGLNFPAGYFLDELRADRLVSKSRELRDRNIRLGIELTERQLLGVDDRNSISYLRRCGLEILIDDFGTGQTSLSMLETTEIDYLKIDRCFVDSIGSGSVNAPVLDGIINMANGLGFKLVAEGVETQVQADYLVSRGVVVHQGYMYSKPVPFNALELVGLIASKESFDGFVK